MTHIPYTYLLRFKPTGQLYYGARWGKNCHPGDLWVTYFTSSRNIKKLIERYGKDAFDFEVRQKCHDARQVIKIEARVHRLMGVAESNLWLNRHSAASGFYNPGRKGAIRSAAQCKAISDALTGLRKSPEHVEKMAATKRGVKQRPDSIAARVAKNTGKRWTAEMKDRHSERMLGQYPMYLNVETKERRRIASPPNGDWILWSPRSTGFYRTPWGIFSSATTAARHSDALTNKNMEIIAKCKSGEDGYSFTRLV